MNWYFISETMSKKLTEILNDDFLAFHISGGTTEALHITAKNGDIVVAMTDENEVTLKTFYKEKDYFRLQPENDFMNPIILKNVTVLGKAIGLYRKF